MANEDISEVLKKDINCYFSSKTQSRIARSNNPSKIGHPCVRYCVLSRLVQADDYDESLMRIFHQGRIEEDSTINFLNSIGYRVYQQEVMFEDKTYNITGKVDGQIKKDGKEYFIEIKGISPYNFDSIKNLDELLNHKQYYIRGYYDQVQTYLHLTKTDEMIIIIKNKNSMDFNVIPIYRDNPRIASILSKCREINNYVKEISANKENIEVYEYNKIPGVHKTEICRVCQYRSNHCLAGNNPDSEITVELEKHIASDLQRLEELRGYHNEYVRLDRLLKEEIKAKNKEDILIPGDGGSWHITTTTVDRKEYKVSAGSYKKLNIEWVGNN